MVYFITSVSKSIPYSVLLLVCRRLSETGTGCSLVDGEREPKTVTVRIEKVSRLLQIWNSFGMYVAKWQGGLIGRLCGYRASTYEGVVVRRGVSSVSKNRNGQWPGSYDFQHEQGKGKKQDKSREEKREIKEKEKEIKIISEAVSSSSRKTRTATIHIHKSTLPTHPSRSYAHPCP